MRSHVAAWCLATLVLCPTLIAQPTLAPKKLDALKRGTVFIRSEAAQRCGSGFLVARREDTAFVMTNAHVLAPQSLHEQSTLEIVLDAGTPKAKSVTATVVCVDESTDLALLSFQAKSPLPTLPLAQKADVPETTPVFVLGFPFGEALAGPNKTPAVTITRAAVSARRANGDGVIEALQLDGEVNPGNSGGPIVNGEGEVLGVVVAKVSGTAITFGIPVSAVRGVLGGRVRQVSFGMPDESAKSLTLNASVQLLDPLGCISSVSIVTTPTNNDQAIEPGKTGEYRKLPHAKESKLKLSGDQAAGRIRLKKSAVSPKRYLYQVKVMRKSDRAEYTCPTELPMGGTPAAVPSQPPASPPKPPGPPRPPGRPKPPGDSPPPETPQAPPPSEPSEDFGKPSGPLAAEKTVRLPAEVEAVAVAGGGRYLVMKLRDTPALTVFDTFKGEGVKHIRLPSADFAYSAGGNIAVVHLRTENLLQSYDLTTLERRKSKPNPFGAVITNLVMGRSRGGRALVRHSLGTDQSPICQMSLLDTTRLQEIEIPPKDRQPAIPTSHASFREKLRHCTNRDLSLVAEYIHAQSPGGFCLLAQNGSTYEQRSEHDSPGIPVIGDDGRVYTLNGRIYSNRLERLETIQGMDLIPAFDGSFFIALSAEGKMTLYEAGKNRPLTPVGEFPRWKKDDNTGGGRPDDLSMDQRLVFDPANGRLAFIPPDNVSIVLRPFDLRATLEQSGVDYLVVTSQPAKAAKVKTKWSYQVEAISKAGGITYSLELAPDGMQVSKSGLVTWTPEEPLPPGGEKIIVLVKDKSGEETFHTFVIAPVSK